jgi:hypothetical protein
MFEDVKAFCLFIGYAWSGRTLVESLPNSNPDVGVAPELDVLRFVQLRLRRIHLVELCKIPGVDAPRDYLEACGSVVKSPSPSRDHVRWSEAERHQVEALIDGRPILAGYAFEDENRRSRVQRCSSVVWKTVNA